MKNSRGFTLIEILVALTIMATIFAAVTFSTRDDTWLEMQDESEKFRDILIDLTDHSSFRQTSYGIYITETGYWWLERSEVSQNEETGDPIFAWTPIENERFQNNEFEDIYIFELKIDDSQVALLPTFPNKVEELEVGLEEIEDNAIYTDSFNSSASDDETGIIPHIYIDLNGELSNAFDIRIIEDNDNFEQQPITYQILSDGFNRPEITRILEGDI
ncbi:MAG: prepilin-type N-terminal cleavage/methylation domain-containing protein [Saccharospirillaceae bacterium]|nr:prepilin-type N-terminal cleavage/methylation domain-containing protein [Pseudomonadales bacterium]NRB80530.1 prepilin-type N-terminal cleavage/methylation domain-containing protein [Saccharospirillaceae bacterium]